MKAHRVNNKAAYQHAQMGSLIRALVIHCTSITSTTSADWFVSDLVGPPKDNFLVTRLIYLNMIVSQYISVIMIWCTSNVIMFVIIVLTSCEHEKALNMWGAK